MSDRTCYEKLYGKLVEVVPHYNKIRHKTEYVVVKFRSLGKPSVGTSTTVGDYEGERIQ